VTLNQIAALAADTIFQGQVRSAAMGRAMTTVAAPPTNNGITDQAQWGFAQAVITDGCTALLPRITWGIAATPGFAAIPQDNGNQNDAAISSAMVGQWENLALITGAQLAQTKGN
jgi:hypothetical protein